MTPDEVVALEAGAAKLRARMEQLRGLSRRLPPEIKAELNRLGHGADPDGFFMCNAHDEGLQCCLDILAGQDPQAT
jgi:hypothetical protein